MIRLIIPILVILVVLGGCASKTDMELAKLHYQSQQKEQKPIFLMEAHEGQTIQLLGVKTFAVYDQSQQTNVTPYKKSYHPAWSILGSAVQVALPIYAQGYSMYKLAEVVGKSAGSNWSNTGDYRDNSPDNNSSNYDISGRAYSNDDYTSTPTIVNQPAPVIVTQPEPVIVQPAEPVIVTQPEPIIVTQPEPIIVTP